MTVRLEILGDDGHWREVPGIRSVELHSEEPTEPPDGPPDDAYWRRYDALDSLVFSMTAYVPRRPRVIDQDGNPVQPRTDRPAWQSPYGPARRSHRP